MNSVAARLLVVVSTAAVLAACGGGGGGASSALPAPGATMAATNVPRVNEVQTVASNLAGQQRSDGAILYTSTMIEPYYANIAAMGALHSGVDFANVQHWMQWYTAHSYAGNQWSIPGAITDYNVASNGSLSSTGSADSVDSYAATFISLAAAAWRDGNAQLQNYVAGSRSSIELIASAIDAVTDTDGLTWATPTYRLKYVMDNSEVYQGLLDLAFLRSQVFGDIAGAALASAHAQQVQAAINAKLWDPTRNQFAVAVDNQGMLTWPQAGNWYDATTQLWPILHGVVAPTSQPAQMSYSQFSNAFPGWPALQKPDPFPWVSVAYVALQMNDVSRATTYANAVQQTYAPGFAYPWYCAESGWYLRLLIGLTAPATVASL
jgi:hypothetical protein